MKKVITPPCLGVIMILSCLASVLEGSFTWSESDGKITITGYSGSDTVLAVPEEINGLPVVRIGERAFYRDNSLESVIIPASVEVIEDRAFLSCDQLTQITLGKGVASIGISFALKNLSAIEVDPENPFFADQSGILFDKTLSTLYRVPPALSGSFDVPDSVTVIEGSSFWYCDEITHIEIPDTVTHIDEGAFVYCKALVSVTLPANLPFISNDLFRFCDVLGSVTIPNSVTTIGNNAFSECFQLSEVVLPESLEAIGEQAFSACESLAAISLPEATDSIGNYAFAGCKALTSVTIPGNVTSVGEGSFSRCQSLTEILVDPANADYTSLDGVLFDKSLTTLVQFLAGLIGPYTVPESVTSIAGGAFTGASIADISLGSNLASIGELSFYDCDQLTELTIPNTVTSIGNWAFGWCENLERITLSQSLQAIDDYMLYGCSSLKSITIPVSVNSIGSNSFSHCKELNEVVISDGLQSIGRTAFGWCTGLLEVTLPSTLSSLDSQVFRGCSSLYSVRFLGTPPTFGSGLFDGTYIEFMVYYIEGMPGWDSTFAGKPTSPFDPWWLWGTYEILESPEGNYADTQEWLGWVEVSYSPLVWHLGTGSWLYVPEEVATAGTGWIYVFDLVPNTPDLWLVLMEGTSWGYSYGLSKWMYVTESGWVYLVS
ncbi:MAG: leucine-rich repeat domain-containing protein [Puniceicoccaceae bacterium]